MGDADSALNVLALNSGSSSLKFALFRMHSPEPQLLLSGEADSIGAKTGAFTLRRRYGQDAVSETIAFPSQEDALAHIANALKRANMPPPDAIGHRVVHGGPMLRAHCRIDEHVLEQLERAARLAPLHVPAAISLIRFTQNHFPNVPQIACFDTAFHATMPDVARVLPLPEEARPEGVQRYGFHGLSCESIMVRLADSGPRVVIAHLGSGCSITAVRHGQSIDTSMGMTPTGGVVMGTRSGDLDPGVLIYLLREERYDVSGLEELVDRRSGLLGVSGTTGDMRGLRAQASTSADARLAIQMFGYSVCKHIAGMIAVLGGIDLLVFTGGIGQNDAETRAEICGNLAWTGIVLDAERNRRGESSIGAARAMCRVLVLPSEEEKQIARHVWILLSH
jgi:acetate kinase